MYLCARQGPEIDERFRKAYAGHADEMLAEISDLMDAQACEASLHCPRRPTGVDLVL